MTEFPGSDGLLIWSLLWQTTLCLLAGGCASYLWANCPARGHRLLLLAQVAALSLPLLSILFRQLNWGLFPDNGQIVDVALAAPETLVATDNGRVLSVTAGVPAGTAESNIKAQQIAVAPRGPTESSAAADVTGTRAMPPLNWPAALGLGWVILSCVVIARLARSWRLGCGLLSTAQPISNALIDRGVKAAMAKLGLERAPDVRCSERVCCPVIWAWRHTPVLVIPTSLAADATSVDWESIACHELAHWKRRDQLTGLFSWTFVALLPWHPLGWWAHRRLQELSEQACDDWVLSCGRSATSYAETLLMLIPQRPSALALAAVSTRGNLRARLARLLDGRRREPIAGLRWTACLVLLTSLLVSGMALAQRQSRIRVQPVQRGPVSIRVEARGILESSHAIDLRNEVQGNSHIITLAPEGKLVRKGDLLIELDEGKLREQVLIETVNAQYTAPKQLAQAESERDSFVDSGTDASKLSKAVLDANVAAAKIAAELAAQRLAQFKVKLAKCKIFSPTDGVFMHYQGRAAGKLAEGAMVRERQIIAQVVDPNRLHVKANLPASWAVALKPGQAAVIRVDAFPNQVLKGELKQVKPTSELVATSSLVLEHEALIAREPTPFAQRPGFTITVEFPIVELPDVIRVPLQAIERRGDRAYCLVQAPAGVERREILVGLSNEEFAEVKRGVTEGEQLVVNPWRKRRAVIAPPPTEAKESVVKPPPPDKPGTPQVPQDSRPPSQQSLSGRPSRTHDTRRVKLDFHAAGWSQVLTWLAEQLQLNLKWQELPPGTLDLKSRETRTVAQAFDTINAILLSQGYTMAMTDDLLLVSSLENLDQHMVPRVTLDELNERGEHEICRVLFQVRGTTVEKLAVELKPLLNKFGRIVGLSASNSLEVMDTAGNLRQLREVIRKSEPVDIPNRVPMVFLLKYAKAAVTATVLRGLVTEDAGPSEDFKQTSIAVDDRLNAIIVSAPPDVLDRVANLIKILDTQVE